MIDASIAAAMPCRMVESKPMRDEPVKTDAQTRESPFSRALESAKERTDLPPDTESAVKKRLAQARSETESKSEREKDQLGDGLRAVRRGRGHYNQRIELEK